MRTKNLFPIIALLAIVVAGCASLYTATVTTTETVDVGMKAWADLSVNGNTDPTIDKAVIDGHKKYQLAAVVARDALIAYKAGGDKANYQKAFEAARAAMVSLLDIIIPLLQAPQQAQLQARIGKATAL